MADFREVPVALAQLCPVVLFCGEPCILYYIEDHGKILFIWNLDPAVLIRIISPENISQPLQKHRKRIYCRLARSIISLLLMPFTSLGFLSHLAASSIAAWNYWEGRNWLIKIHDWKSTSSLLHAHYSQCDSVTCSTIQHWMKSSKATCPFLWRSNFSISVP